LTKIIRRQGNGYANHNNNADNKKNFSVLRARLLLRLQLTQLLIYLLHAPSGRIQFIANILLGPADCFSMLNVTLKIIAHNTDANVLHI